jgi:hypothetical protein
MPNTNLFENPDSIRQCLEKLALKAKSGATFQELIDLYKTEIGILPVYPMKIQKGAVLFRARRNTGDVKDLFKSLDEIGMKPKEMVKEFGRANLPNQAVFYASSNEETVVQEINQWHINDQGRFQDFISKGGLTKDWRPHTCFLTISAWMVTEEINVALLFGNEESRPPVIQDAKIKREALGHQSTNYKKSWNLIIDFFQRNLARQL